MRTDIKEALDRTQKLGVHLWKKHTAKRLDGALPASQEVLALAPAKWGNSAGLVVITKTHVLLFPGMDNMKSHSYRVAEIGNFRLKGGLFQSKIKIFSSKNVNVKLAKKDAKMINQAWLGLQIEAA